MANTNNKKIAGAFSQKKRKEQLEAERTRLSAIENRFQDDGHLVLVNCILDELAFMNVELSEAKEIVKKSGIIEEYQNGEHQKGYKKSSAIETYDKLVNSRLRCIKQLTDMLPPPAILPGEGQAETPEAALRRFIAGDF